MRAPETIETARLILRRPRASDAQAVFDRYAGDQAVTRYLSWPAHRNLADTLAFLSWSDEEWQRWPSGPYLVLSRSGGPARVLGSTGLKYKSPTRAETGYVFARDAWGQRFAAKPWRQWLGLRSGRASNRLRRCVTWITSDLSERAGEVRVPTGRGPAGALRVPEYRATEEVGRVQLCETASGFQLLAFCTLRGVYCWVTPLPDSANKFLVFSVLRKRYNIKSSQH